MARSSGLKRTQVQGKRYNLPEEDIEIEKLIKKGLSLSAKMEAIKGQLDRIKAQLIDISRSRRDGTTTVSLKGISGASTVTFRESYDCDEHVEEIRHELGSLFDRFLKKTSFKTTKDLKDFLEGTHDHGLPDADKLKDLVLCHVTRKETKPNVKFTPAE